MIIKKRIFFRMCECDNRLEIGIGKAGGEIECPQCGKRIEVGPLSELRETVEITKVIETPNVFQFGLQGMMLLFLPFALIAWSIGEFGVSALAPLAILLPIIVYVVLVLVVATFVHKIEKIRAWFWD